MKKYNYIIIGFLSVFLWNCSEDKIDFEQFGIITGKIVEANTFEPITNAKVSISPSNTSTFTDENGEYEFLDVAEGDYSVKAEKDLFITGFEPTTVKADQSVHVIIELDKSDALNKPPSVPNLLLPQDNSTNQGVSVQLSWSEAVDPDEDEINYKIIIKNDLNSDVITIENILETSYEISNLEYGIKYFWQIVASDGINNEVLSEVFNFETNNFPNNRFLFVRVINGNNVIYSSDENGNEIAITSPNENCWRPRKNTVTQQIAFLKTVNSQTHLFIMQPNGESVQQVTATIQPTAFKQSEIDFSWSLNGNKLIYSSFDKLYKINKDGSGNQLIYQTGNGNLITECDWSANGSFIALKTNNYNGYQCEIFTIDMSGSILQTILNNVNGAVGGLNISVDNQKILYTYDISAFENSSYRQLNSHLFIYDLISNTSTDYSTFKIPGTNDLDPRFSPNEAKIIMVNTSNDGLSQKNIITVDLNNLENRNLLFEDAQMPDWE